LKGIPKGPELEGSSKGKAHMRDMTKPVGDACRDDGTLKEANEMVWPDSPTALEAPQNEFREYDDMYDGFQDEPDQIDLPSSIKVNSVLCF
jgi:hypothetical protein